jgi:hypothetical protein
MASVRSPSVVAFFACRLAPDAILWLTMDARLPSETSKLPREIQIASLSVIGGGVPPIPSV